MKTAQPHTESKRKWTLTECRALFSRLTKNRRDCWTKANFFVKSKWSALTTIEANVCIADKKGWDGYIELIDKNNFALRQIIPGENSRYKGIRADILDLIEQVENYLLTIRQAQ